MVLAQNETCAICGQKIGKAEKGCLYILDLGYVHYSCREKQKTEEALL